MWAAASASTLLGDKVELLAPDRDDQRADRLCTETQEPQTNVLHS